MAWSDIFIPSGKITADEQQANYERLQKLNAERLAQNAGMLTQEQYDQNAALQKDSLNSQNAGALVGAAQGSVELVTDPAQWAKDTKEGAAIAADAASGAVGFSFDIVGTLLKGIFRAIPVWAWLAAGVALFFYFGGSAVVRRKVKAL